MSLFFIQYVMHLLAHLALLNLGQIDWDEYIPTMYVRFMKIFKLPVYYKKEGHIKMSKMSEERVASWIVCTLVRITILVNLNWNHKLLYSKQWNVFRAAVV